MSKEPMINYITAMETLMNAIKQISKEHEWKVTTEQHFLNLDKKKQTVRLTIRRNLK